MRIRLKRLRANPFRNLPTYPIDRRKVEKLKSSIKRTTFWDNIVVRPHPNGDALYFQIAYGHHRLEALRELYDEDHKIGVIVRDLGDEQMLKMMAAENDDAYDLTPVVVAETVQAVRDFFKLNHKLLPTDEEMVEHFGRKAWGATTGFTREQIQIAYFLDWPKSRVKYAIGLLQSPHLRELERLPHLGSARFLMAAIERHELDDHVTELVDNVIDHDRYSQREINDLATAVAVEKLDAEAKVSYREKSAAQFLKEVAQQSRSLTKKIREVRNQSVKLSPAIFTEAESFELSLSLTGLAEELVLLQREVKGAERAKLNEARPPTGIHDDREGVTGS